MSRPIDVRYFCGASPGRRARQPATDICQSRGKNRADFRCCWRQRRRKITPPNQTAEQRLLPRRMDRCGRKMFQRRRRVRLTFPQKEFPKPPPLPRSLPPRRSAICVTLMGLRKSFRPSFFGHFVAEFRIMPPTQSGLVREGNFCCPRPPPTRHRQTAPSARDPISKAVIGLGD